MARMTLEQIWLSATTLQDSKGRPQVWRRTYSQSPKRQINMIVPFLGTKTVLVTASFWGLTEKAVHVSNILFMNCEIIEEIPEPVQQETQELTVIDQEKEKQVQKTPYGGVNPPYDSSTHFRITYQNKNYWIKKFDMKRQNVLIRCSCSDYFFRFSYYNYVNAIQFGGKSRAYVRKTSNFPEVNKNHVVGLCKHVSGLSQALQTNGLAL